MTIDDQGRGGSGDKQFLWITVSDPYLYFGPDGVKSRERTVVQSKMEHQLSREKSQTPESGSTSTHPYQGSPRQVVSSKTSSSHLLLPPSRKVCLFSTYVKKSILSLLKCLRTKILFKMTHTNSICFTTIPYIPLSFFQRYYFVLLCDK